MTKKILIVDDEPDISEIISIYFQSHSWVTERAENGKIALEKIKEFEPDVILSDITMPVVDGMQLLEELDRRQSDIPLIFVSGFRDLEKMKKAWSLCAFDFLDKPFDEGKMLLAAENAFEYGKDYVQSARKRFSKFKKVS